MTIDVRGPVTIRSLKYDHGVRKTWQANLVEHTGDRIVLEGVFDKDVVHPELGLIEAGTRSVEYFWTDGWYSIFRFYHPVGGHLRNIYCNVNMPPVFTGETLEYIDLDLDVLVWPDGSYSVLDVDEFNENAREYNYPEWVKKKAHEALDQLVILTETNSFPR